MMFKYRGSENMAVMMFKYRGTENMAVMMFKYTEEQKTWQL